MSNFLGNLLAGLGKGIASMNASLTPDQVTSLATEVLQAAGGPNTAVQNALKSLPGAFGSNRIQGLVDVIENNLTTFPPGLQAQLEALPALGSGAGADVTKYNQAINNINTLVNTALGGLSSVVARL